jgi:hypothetical protein
VRSCDGVCVLLALVIVEVDALVVDQVTPALLIVLGCCCLFIFFDSVAIAVGVLNGID